MKTKLPFDISPGCIAYHNKAFPLGIMKANIDNYDEWLAGKLINCVCNVKDYSFNIIEDDIWGYRQGVTETQSISITPIVFSERIVDLCTVVKYMLQSQYYLTGTYNEFYIPQKKPYKEFDFIHDYIIFGYDDEHDVFHSAGYIDTQKYELFDIKYHDYLESIYNVHSSKVNLWFHKINSGYAAELNIEDVVSRIRHYVNSTHIRTSDNLVYGIDAWNMLARYIVENQKPFLDLRYTRLFMEHKYLMLSRLKVLQRKVQSFSDGLINAYKEGIFDSAKQLHYMCLKFNISHDSSIIDKSKKLVEVINQEEYRIISDIFGFKD